MDWIPVGGLWGSLEQVLRRAEEGSSDDSEKWVGAYQRFPFHFLEKASDMQLIFVESSSTMSVWENSGTQLGFDLLLLDPNTLGLSGSLLSWAGVWILNHWVISVHHLGCGMGYFFPEGVDGHLCLNYVGPHLGQDL